MIEDIEIRYYVPDKDLVGDVFAKVQYRVMVNSSWGDWKDAEFYSDKLKDKFDPKTGEKKDKDK